MRWENVIQLSTINLHLGFHIIDARREIVRDIDRNRHVFSGELIVIHNVLQRLLQNSLSGFVHKRENERTHAIVALQGADGAEERLCRSYAQRFFAPKFTVPSVARTIVKFIFHIAFVGCDFKFQLRNIANGVVVVGVLVFGGLHHRSYEIGAIGQAARVERELDAVLVDLVALLERYFFVIPLRSAYHLLLRIVDGQSESSLEGIALVDEMLENNVQIGRLLLLSRCTFRQSHSAFSLACNLDVCVSVSRGKRVYISSVGMRQDGIHVLGKTQGFSTKLCSSL